MKQRILLLIVFVAVSLASSAQDNSFRRELAVGVSGGVAFSSVNFIPKVYQGMLQGYTGGVLMRWVTENHLGLQLEVNYTQQGWSEDFPDHPDEGYVYKRMGHYVEVPFLTHIYFGGKRVRFFINAGPKVGYLISEETEHNLRGAKPNRVNEQHFMPIENYFDWGLCGGPGIELRTGVGSFLLEGRFYYALGDLFGNLKSDVFAKSSEQVLSVKLSYLFRVK